MRKTPGVCGGSACIRDTRVPVWAIIGYIRQRLNPHKILNLYPGLTPSDIQAAVDYYTANKTEIDRDIQQNESSNADIPESRQPAQSRALHSFEDWSIMASRQTTYVPEAYSGTSIVQWYGNIERQLSRMLDENEAIRQYSYADKIREFLKIWRTNEITGSLNRETIEVLNSAAQVLAVDTWNLADYFSNLRDQLRKLLASQEELPTVPMDNNDMRGGGGPGRGGMPPLRPEFGTEKETGLNPEGGGEAPLPGEGTPEAGEEKKQPEQQLPV